MELFQKCVDPQCSLGNEPAKYASDTLTATFILENSPAAQAIAESNNKPITNIDRLLADLQVDK